MKQPHIRPPSSRRSAHFRRRRVLGGAAVGALGLLAAAGPGTATAQTAVIEGELRVIGFEVFYGLDPVHEFTPGYMRSVGAAEGLLRITPFGDVDVDLARSYEMVDPFTWQVALRPEVTFWSGKPADARAVVGSLERSRQLAPFAATLLKGIRIEPGDEWTVMFQSDSPIPGLPLNLANEWLMIHNAESYGPEDNSYDLSVVDLTGFYKITALEPRVRAVLERNDRYWGVRPRMPRIRFDEIADSEARSLAGLSGEAHIVRSVSTQAAPQVERSRTMRLVSIPSTSTVSAYLNVERAPFDDVRVRQALAWAVDRDELVAVALDGLGTGLPSWLAPNPAYPEAKRVGYTRQDPVKAAELLDQAGWRLPAGRRVRMKDGAPLRLRVLWFGPYRPVVEVLQAQWTKIGAEVEVQGSPDYGIIQSKRAQNDWDIFIEGWGTFGEPAAILSRHVAPDGDLNYMRFRDPQIEAWLDGFADLLDPEERRQQALQINERHAELVPMIPLYTRNLLTAVSRNLRNYVPHFLGNWYDVHPDLWVAA